MNRMRAYLWIIGLAMPVLFSSCSKKIHYQSHYVPTKIIVDGDLSDWKTEFTYHSGSKLAYAISHDDQNLYLAFKTRDENTIRKILMRGMTTWVDTSAKKNENFGIKYPYRERKPFKNITEKKQNKKLENNLENRATKKVINKFIERKAKYQVYDGKESYIADPAKSTQFQVKAIIDTTGYLNYELKIPFSAFYKHEIDLSLEHIVSIGFVSEVTDIVNRQADAFAGETPQPEAKVPRQKEGMSPRNKINGNMAPGARPAMSQMADADPIALWLKRVLIKTGK